MKEGSVGPSGSQHFALKKAQIISINNPKKT
jgi:hypothetical protein